MQLPKLDIPVLAKIELQGDLGLESWFEVVLYLNGWCTLGRSDTFQNGEQVVDWVYVEDCFGTDDK